jgi:single-strand DNA-binding protein
MSAIRNSILLVGNLGNAPEVKETKTGKKVATFSLATNESYTNPAGKKVTNTDWHECEAWNGVAGVIEQFGEKGKKIAVSGKLTYQSYENKNGVNVKKAYIKVSDIELL